MTGERGGEASASQHLRKRMFRSKTKPKNQEQCIVKNEICHTNRNSFNSTVAGCCLFSVLNQARFQGRPLSFEEKQGFANLAFAGGRDTVIATVTRIFAEAATDPELLPAIRATPDLAVSAVEEIVRITTPLTAISRTGPRDTAVQKAGGRIGLCWASANREDRFFPEPDRFQAARNPNPHVGFGFGPHNCLGATHARLLLRTLVRVLAEQEVTLRIQTQEPQCENHGGITRVNGFQNLLVDMMPISHPCGGSVIEKQENGSEEPEDQP